MYKIWLLKRQTIITDILNCHILSNGSNVLGIDLFIPFLNYLCENRAFKGRYYFMKLQHHCSRSLYNFVDQIT